MIETIAHTGFAICINDVGYPASLDLHTVYDVLPDGESELGLIRIVDESGDSYLYPEEYFVVISEVVPFERRIPDEKLTDLERATRGYIEDHVDILNEGTLFARSRTFTQGSAIFVALTEETVSITNHAANVKRELARAANNIATPAHELMKLERVEQSASQAFVQSTIVSQEMQGFLMRVRELIPKEFSD